MDGLKVYINGTFTAGDQVGSVSESYGDPYPDLVIGTGNDKAYGHYVTGAFDEFVIWERALSPEDILLYYSAAIGKDIMVHLKVFPVILLPPSWLCSEEIGVKKQFPSLSSHSTHRIHA